MIAPWIPVLLWIGVIAFLGSPSFALDETSRFIGPLLRWLFHDWSDGRIATLHGAIRKLAHMAEYAVAAILTFRALWQTRGPLSRIQAALPTLALLALVALADEGRQARGTARTGSGYDVLLDLAGGVAGLVAAPLAVVCPSRRRRKEHG